MANPLTRINGDLGAAAGFPEPTVTAPSRHASPVGHRTGSLQSSRPSDHGSVSASGTATSHLRDSVVSDAPPLQPDVIPTADQLKSSIPEVLAMLRHDRRRRAPSQGGSTLTDPTAFGSGYPVDVHHPYTAPLASAGAAPAHAAAAFYASPPRSHSMPPGGITISGRYDHVPPAVGPAPTRAASSASLAGPPPREPVGAIARHTHGTASVPHGAQQGPSPPHTSPRSASTHSPSVPQSHAMGSHVSHGSSGGMAPGDMAALVAHQQQQHALQVMQAHVPSSLRPSPPPPTDPVVTNIMTIARKLRTDRWSVPEGPWLAHLNDILDGPAVPYDELTPAHLLENLYLGNIAHAQGVDALRAKGVTHILNCAPGMCPTGAAMYPDMTYYEIDATDAEDYELLPSHFEHAMLFLHSVEVSGGIAFVHCFAGINRSACICVAFLMALCGMPLLEACKFVYDRRPIVLKNVGFRRQLLQLAMAADPTGTSLLGVCPPRGTFARGPAPTYQPPSAHRMVEVEYLDPSGRPIRAAVPLAGLPAGAGAAANGGMIIKPHGDHTPPRGSPPGTSGQYMGGVSRHGYHAVPGAPQHHGSSRGAHAVYGNANAQHYVQHAGQQQGASRGYPGHPSQGSSGMRQQQQQQQWAPPHGAPQAGAGGAPQGVQMGARGAPGQPPQQGQPQQPHMAANGGAPHGLFLPPGGGRGAGGAPRGGGGGLPPQGPQSGTRKQGVMGKIMKGLGR